MAGKKGRSGRKRKNPQIIKENPKPVISAQQPTVQAAPAGDPFLKLEQEIRQAMPAPVAPVGEIVPEKPKRKPPENLIRAAWRWIYGAEDAFFRARLGLGNESRGIFTDESLVEAHVQPSVQLVEKYVPERILNDLEEKTPLIMFGAAFAEAQISIFAKFQQLVNERTTHKVPVEKKVPGGGGGIQYPTAEDLKG